MMVRGQEFHFIAMVEVQFFTVLFAPFFGLFRKLKKVNTSSEMIYFIKKVMKSIIVYCFHSCPGAELPRPRPRPRNPFLYFFFPGVFF